MSPFLTRQIVVLLAGALVSTCALVAAGLSERPARSVSQHDVERPARSG